ncbi:tail collar protein [Cohnella kolymensis]|uniref:Tail collar protein n=1 Tax=Cohnella kolymensis TaxID=1590652 RepID=A0ABR5A3F9_9BACL|nr:tail fiber protein [Cohnella kolymensis]KIL35594.1 tail collar protein [Cohnella kolymensis]
MSECYVGEIRMFGGTFAPLGWAFCDGSLLQISQYETLYTLLGTTFGGDGISTFGLPDLRGRIPLHTGVNPNTGTQYSLGQAGGTETVTLSLQQLAAHTHIVNANSTTGESTTPQNHVWGYSDGGRPYVASPPNGTMNPSSVSPFFGGNQPHDNMMPFLTISFIIALEGIYPSQN